MLESIIKGVNEPVEVNDKEFKINVADEETIIFLLVFVPWRVYVPSDEIVTVLSLTEYPVPDDNVDEKSIVYLILSSK